MDPTTFNGAGARAAIDAEVSLRPRRWDCLKVATSAVRHLRLSPAVPNSCMPRSMSRRRSGRHTSAGSSTAR